MALAGWSWLSSAPASALHIPEIEPAEAAAWRAGLQLSQLEQHYADANMSDFVALGEIGESFKEG